MTISSDTSIPAAIIGVIFGRLLSAIIRGWGIMLALGIIHLNVISSVSPVGFPISYALGLASTLIWSPETGASK